MAEKLIGPITDLRPCLARNPDAARRSAPATTVSSTDSKKPKKPKNPVEASWWGDRSTTEGPGTAAPREAAPGPGARVEGALAPKAFATVPVTTDAGGETRPANAVQEPPAWQPAALAATGHANAPYSAEHRRLNDNLLGLPSMDTIDRILGKLSEREYQHLMSRMDGLVAVPVLIGTDPVTTRERTVHEEDRQRVAFVLRRDGEEAARNLAKNLGVAPRSGLCGGSDTYYYQSESEGDDDHTGNSQMYQHYVVRDDDDLLYRNDTRDPDEIFEIGFQSRIPDSNVTLMDHVWTGPSRSQWVSTSRRDDLWRFGGYHYEIDAPGQGVDVEMTYGDDYPHLVRKEKEVAFEGGIDRSFIIGADEQPIPGYGSGNFRAGEDSGSFYFVNPHFEFPAGVTRSGGTRIQTRMETDLWRASPVRCGFSGAAHEVGHGDEDRGSRATGWVTQSRACAVDDPEPCHSRAGVPVTRVVRWRLLSRWGRRCADGTPAAEPCRGSARGR